MPWSPTCTLSSLGTSCPFHSRPSWLLCDYSYPQSSRAKSQGLSWLSAAPQASRGAARADACAWINRWTRLSSRWCRSFSRLSITPPTSSGLWGAGRSWISWRGASRWPKHGRDPSLSSSRSKIGCTWGELGYPLVLALPPSPRSHLWTCRACCSAASVFLPLVAFWPAMTRWCCQFVELLSSSVPSYVKSHRS